MKRPVIKEDKLKRTNRVAIMLNSREMRAFNLYCTRFRVSNRSQFLRETVMKEILRRFDEEHPTLWEAGEPSLFSEYSEGAEKVKKRASKKSEGEEDKDQTAGQET